MYPDTSSSAPNLILHFAYLARMIDFLILLRLLWKSSGCWLSEQIAALTNCLY
jgi:hypothetical protein